MSNLSSISRSASAVETKQVKIPKLLHRKLKRHAVEHDKYLEEVVEDQLWPLVGGKPNASHPSPESGQ